MSDRSRGSAPQRPARRALRVLVVGVALLLAAASVGAIVAAQSRIAKVRAIAAQEAAAFTPDPLESIAASGIRIAVVGGDEVEDAAPGVSTDDRWTALLASALGAEVVTDTSSGAGYVEEGSDGRTFAEVAASVPTDADLVLIVGGQADEGTEAADLSSATSGAIAAARRRAPLAQVVVIGPIVSDGVTRNELAGLQGPLRRAADSVNAVWVDPTGANWLPSRAGTLPASARALTAADERAIAVRLRGTLLTLLD